MGRLQKILIVVVLLLLNLPWLSDVLGFKEPHPLHGASTELPMPDLSIDSIWNGDFQYGIDEYLRTNFILRGLAIRTRNQLDYTLFDQTHARSVLMGKEGYLFEENYINAALGTDHLSEQKVSERVDDLETLADSLDIPVFVVLAPGKASYYMEFIPDVYFNSDSLNLNNSYNLWRNHLNMTKSLYLVDLHAHFNHLDDVFPKNGIHWCEWAQVDAFNIINDHLSSHLIEGLQPAKFVIDSSYRSSSMEGTDDDIERGLNLWQNIDDIETTYYKTSWEDIDDALKPKVLIVGDSYAWGVVNRGILSNSYMDGEFWYYNQVVHGPKYLGTEDFGGKPFDVHDVHNNSDLIYALNNFDAVILLSTDANLHVFPFEFGLIK
ncbi:MAG: hypothetical protein O2852_05980 [Bacteroidetes bacterium]|nr:hypothetical protein [Bacteroidota bacterium]